LKIKMPWGFLCAAIVLMLVLAACGGNSPSDPEQTLFDIDADDFGPYSSITATYPVTDLAGWNTAIAAITAPGNYVINVTGSITVPGTSTDTFAASGITVSLRGSGTITIGSTDGSALRIATGQTLILRNVTLKGKSANDAAVVYCDGGTLKMLGGEISGNTITAASTHGGGVYIASGSTFTMTGGIISGNTVTIGAGGGVYLATGGTFTMTGGEIKKNTAYIGGGVIVISLGFSKTGGTIYGSDGGSDANTVTTAYGHAVLWNGWLTWRTTTAGPGVNLFALSASDHTNPPWGI
jgi:hypothetical protein